MADSRIVKTVSAFVFCVLVVAGAAWFLKSRMGRPSAPKAVLERPTDKVDTKTLEVITLGWGDWEKLGQREGLYKHPRTGEYTMADALTCGACGKVMPFPGMTLEPGSDEPKPPKWICPHCGRDPRAAGPRRNPNQESHP